MGAIEEERQRIIRDLCAGIAGACYAMQGGQRGPKLLWKAAINIGHKYGDLLVFLAEAKRGYVYGKDAIVDVAMKNVEDSLKPVADAHQKNTALGKLVPNLCDIAVPNKRFELLVLAELIEKRAHDNEDSQLRGQDGP